MKELFSHASGQYLQFRPSYPKELFEFIVSLTEKQDRAWDCATGNGQAAVSLAAWFENVFATDLSEQQIQHAIGHDRVTYSVGTAESSRFPSDYFDLVTVAQAIHWFNFDLFYAETGRVLKPGGVLAVWCHGLIESSNTFINTAIKTFYTKTLGAFWDPERLYIDEMYQTIPFPYSEISSPAFNIDVSWNKIQLLGFFRTWSAVLHYRNKHEVDPVSMLEKDLPGMDEMEQFPFTFPIGLRIGRKPNYNFEF